MWKVEKAHFRLNLIIGLNQQWAYKWKNGHLRVIFAWCLTVSVKIVFCKSSIVRTIFFILLRTTTNPSAQKVRVYFWNEKSYFWAFFCNKGCCCCCCCCCCFRNLSSEGVRFHGKPTNEGPAKEKPWSSGWSGRLRSQRIWVWIQLSPIVFYLLGYKVVG